MGTFIRHGKHNSAKWRSTCLVRASGLYGMKGRFITLWLIPADSLRDIIQRGCAVNVPRGCTEARASALRPRPVLQPLQPASQPPGLVTNRDDTANAAPPPAECLGRLEAQWRDPGGGIGMIRSAERGGREGMIRCCVAPSVAPSAPARRQLVHGPLAARGPKSRPRGGLSGGSGRSGAPRKWFSRIRKTVLAPMSWTLFISDSFLGIGFRCLDVPY